MAMPYRAWLWGLKESQKPHSTTLQQPPQRARTDEAIQRYRQVNQWLRDFFEADPVKDRRWTARLDRVVVHPVWGSFILFGLLFLLFQGLFYGSEAPMNFIDDQLAALSTWLTSVGPPGFLMHLVSKGVLPGIAGGTHVHPANRATLWFHLFARGEWVHGASRILSWIGSMRPFGLSGKSVVPMVSGTACAIPAIMSTRNMENSRERFLAIAVTPLITCSARLPVYALLIGLVIPNSSFLGMNFRARRFIGFVCLGFCGSPCRFSHTQSLDARQKNTGFSPRDASLPMAPRKECHYIRLESNQKFRHGGGQNHFGYLYSALVPR